MIPRLRAAEHVGGYRILLEFTDGTRGEIDLESELWGEVFEPVREPEFFKSFQVHPELKTLAWPNGADFAPEYFYSAIAASLRRCTPTANPLRSLGPVALRAPAAGER